MAGEQPTKHFITAISQQPMVPGSSNETRLKSVVYAPKNSDSLDYEFEASYPIVPVIANRIDDGECFKLTVIMPEGDDEEKNRAIALNREALFSNIEAIKENLGAEFSYRAEEIPCSYDPEMEELYRLQESICSSLQPGEELYACLTFGQKADSLALYQALQQACTDCRAGCGPHVALCVYGDYSAGLWDATDFVYRSVAGAPDAAKSPAREAGGSKRLITYLSLNPNLRTITYEWPESPDVTIEACYPIALQARRTLQNGDEVILNPIAFTGREQDSAYTMQLLLADMGALDLPAQPLPAADYDGRIFRCQLGEVSFSCRVEMIWTPADVTVETLGRLSTRIAQLIGQGDEVHACITFGQKVDTIALQQGLAEALAKDAWGVDIASCVYGYDPHVPGAHSKLKDVTSFVVDGAAELLMRRDGVECPGQLRSVLRSEGRRGDE